MTGKNVWDYTLLHGSCLTETENYQHSGTSLRLLNTFPMINRSLVRSFVLWFVHSFVRLFLPSLVRSLVRSFVYSFSRPLVRWHLRLFSRSFVGLVSSYTLSCIFSIVWLRFYVELTCPMVLPKGTTADLIDGTPNQEHRSCTGSEKASPHPLVKLKKNSTPVAEDRLDDVSFSLWCL